MTTPGPVVPSPAPAGRPAPRRGPGGRAPWLSGRTARRRGARTGPARSAGRARSVPADGPRPAELPGGDPPLARRVARRPVESIVVVLRVTAMVVLATRVRLVMGGRRGGDVDRSPVSCRRRGRRLHRCQHRRRDDHVQGDGHRHGRHGHGARRRRPDRLRTGRNPMADRARQRQPMDRGAFDVDRRLRGHHRRERRLRLGAPDRKQPQEPALPHLRTRMRKRASRYERDLRRRGRPRCRRCGHGGPSRRRRRRCLGSGRRHGYRMELTAHERHSGPRAAHDAHHPGDEHEAEDQDGVERWSAWIARGPGVATPGPASGTRGHERQTSCSFGFLARDRACGGAPRAGGNGPPLASRRRLDRYPGRRASARRAGRGGDAEQALERHTEHVVSVAPEDDHDQQSGRGVRAIPTPRSHAPHPTELQRARQVGQRLRVATLLPVRPAARRPARRLRSSGTPELRPIKDRR
jgi:hypothetical protein